MLDASDPTISDLILKYPLPAGWAVPEIFEDWLAIGDLRIHMIGLHAKNALTGEESTASAVGVGESPMIRAYFELIERITIIQAEKNPRLTWNKIPRDLVFPISDEPQVWKYSRSNGVAAHPDAKAARQAAAFELIERDRILRSWYGGTAPEPAALPDSFPEASLREHYRIQAFRFPKIPSEIEVAAVFGFPKHAEAPFFCGFGASFSQADAISRAFREGLQRMAFLWGESFSGAEPEPAPTPDFHLEYFARPRGVARLESWLKGKHFLGRSAPARAEVELGSELDRITLVNLTLPEQANSLSVYKAISDTHVPLIFGTRHPTLETSVELSFGVHPIA